MVELACVSEDSYALVIRALEIKLLSIVLLGLHTIFAITGNVIVPCLLCIFKSPFKLLSFPLFGAQNSGQRYQPPVYFMRCTKLLLGRKSTPLLNSSSPCYLQLLLEGNNLFYYYYKYISYPSL